MFMSGHKIENFMMGKKIFWKKKTKQTKQQQQNNKFNITQKRYSEL